MFRYDCWFCHKRVWKRFHKCPIALAMPPAEVGRFLGQKLKAILADEPATKQIHTLYELADEIEQAFNPKELPQCE